MTRFIAPMVGLAFAAALWPAPSMAQGLRNKFSTELSSVSEVALTIGPVDDQGSRCGLAAPDLEMPARHVLESSRLRLNSSSSNVVFAKAIVAAAGETCAAAISVELFRWANDFKASVSVWSHQAVIVGGKSGFDGRVRDRIDAMTKELIADWLLARR